jgi:hypothetical protein
LGGREEFIFKKSFDLSLTKSPKQGVHGRSKYSRRSRSEGITLSKSVDEVQEIGLVGGAKVKPFEYLENILSQKRSEAQERGRP